MNWNINYLYHNALQTFRVHHLWSFHCFKECVNWSYLPFDAPWLDTAPLPILRNPDNNRIRNTDINIFGLLLEQVRAVWVLACLWLASSLLLCFYISLGLWHHWRQEYGFISPYTVTIVYAWKQFITLLWNGCFPRWKSFLLAESFFFQGNPDEIPRSDKLSVIL